MIAGLSSNSKRKRLKAVKLLKKTEDAVPEKTGVGILSAHTDFSFSPFSPSLAAYLAYRGGLAFAGISDHDTLSGAQEFCRAAELLGIQSSVGVQLRVRLSGEKDRILNNMYERGVAFISIRGIPQNKIKKVDKYLQSVRDRRVARDRLMVQKFNSRIKKFDMSIDFDKDILAKSRYSEGGTITERHILYAFARKLIEKLGDAEAILKFLDENLNISIGEEYSLVLSDAKSPYFAHDLVRCLKNEIKFFYLPAEEVISEEEVLRLADWCGGLLTYMYTGGESQFKEELIAELGRIGFDAVEIPIYFAEEERAEIMSLAEKYGMFALPYLDINSPRLRFAPSYDDEQLRRNMWAVIGHEKCSRENPEDGINTEKSVAKNPDLNARLAIYAEAGRISNKI